MSLGVIANLLFIFWMFLYLYCIYEKNYVYVTEGDASGGNKIMYEDEYDDYPDGKRWHKQSKTVYFCAHTLFEFAWCIILILFCIVCYGWLKNHQNS